MGRLRYLLGIITLALMVVGSWFLYRLLEPPDPSEQYQIQVSFNDARGLKSGADVKYRGVPVGSVRRIDVDESGERAVVLMTIAEDKHELVRNNSSFWIVTPRFHGLAAGVTGLDTLVRDSYISFATPQPFGELLSRGSRTRGVEVPAHVPKDVILPPLRRGDLEMRVLLPENHGITVGARVMFRGMATGEVRSIQLAPGGSHVEVRVRISSLHRATVTDASVFWVSQPQVNLRFSFSNPVAVNELSSLISPYIAYYTPPKTGVPVYDNYPVAAHMKRPAIAITEVPKAALAKQPEVDPRPAGPLSLVRVVYEAVDVDWISANDKLHREGTGILFIDKKGRAVVLTARSVCDAAYYYTETFGERARIENEVHRVQLPDGPALVATRTWVEPNGLDMALLLVEDLPRTYPGTKPEAMSFVDGDSVEPDGLLLRLAGEGGVRLKAAPFDLAATKLDESRGGVVLRGKEIVGFVGRVSETDAKRTLVTLKILPESLRPAR